jgi:serine/threonine protein kinase
MSSMCFDLLRTLITKLRKIRSVWYIPCRCTYIPCISAVPINCFVVYGHQSLCTSLLRSMCYFAGAYSIPADKAISEECKDLIRRILVVDPAKRFSIAEIWSHRWVQKGLPPVIATSSGFDYYNNCCVAISRGPVRVPTLFPSCRPKTATEFSPCDAV